MLPLPEKPRPADIVVADAVKLHFRGRAGFLQRRPPAIRAVDGVSFRISRGSCFAIVGESGSGKSTLARMLVGLLRPSEGEVFIDGEPLSAKSEADLRALRRRVQLVLQDPRASIDPRMRVGSVLEEALIVHGLGRDGAERRERMRRVIRQVGLGEEHLDRFANELSGGQRQRVAIARAIICEPEVLVLDEPVSALDVSVQAQIINLLKDLQDKYQMAYLFISHDLSVVEHISDNVGVMYLGNMVEFGDKASIFRNPLHPYTQALLSAAPVPDPSAKRNRIILEGSIPSPANPPSGCKFHTRCRERMEICSQVAPETMEVEPGHFVSCHLYQ